MIAKTTAVYSVQNCATTTFFFKEEPSTRTGVKNISIRLILNWTSVTKRLTDWVAPFLNWNRIDSNLETTPQATHNRHNRAGKRRQSFTGEWKHCIIYVFLCYKEFRMLKLFSPSWGHNRGWVKSPQLVVAHWVVWLKRRFFPSPLSLQQLRRAHAAPVELWLSLRYSSQIMAFN